MRTPGLQTDSNKPLLLANPGFIPYLISGLFVDAGHDPRPDLGHGIKTWNQEYHAECLAQLALFPPAADALRKDPSVQAALRAVVDAGLSEQSKDMARAALLSLQDGVIEMPSGSDDEISPSHIMLSYQCEHPTCHSCVHSVRVSCSPATCAVTTGDAQALILRLNASLLMRGYKVWLDVDMMKGSTLDAMSEAVEGAEVMLYCLSKKCEYTSSALTTRS